MKTFIRLTAAGLLGAHITGALAIYAIESYEKSLRSEPLHTRAGLYLLAPYALSVVVTRDLASELKRAIQHSAT